MSSAITQTTLFYYSAFFLGQRKQMCDLTFFLSSVCSSCLLFIVVSFCFWGSLKNLYLSDVTGSPLAETLRVTKIGRLVALLSDCECKMSTASSDVKDGHNTENIPAKLLTTSVWETVDIINSVNTRVYMPVLKADRAVHLLLVCAKEFGKGQK